MAVWGAVVIAGAPDVPLQRQQLQALRDQFEHGDLAPHELMQLLAQLYGLQAVLAHADLRCVYGEQAYEVRLADLLLEV